MDQYPPLDQRTIRRVFRDWNSLKLLGENPLAGLPLVCARRQAANYSDSAVGRGLALKEVFQAALENLKPEAGPPDPREKRWRPYIILTDQYLRGRSPEWVQEQLHVSKGTYYSEQERALEMLAGAVQGWEEGRSNGRSFDPPPPVASRPSAHSSHGLTRARPASGRTG